MSLKNTLKILTTQPGIYLFYNSKKELIYVGKATSLKNRVRSYFTSSLSFPTASSRNSAGADRESQRLQNNHEIPAFAGMTTKKGATRPIEFLIHEVKNIKTIKTDSILEAIILESNYIKKYHPKYNIKDRDDKSWNYLAITNDQFPKLIAIRQHEVSVIPAGLVPHSSGTGRAGIPSAIRLIPHSRDPRFREDDKIVMFGPFPSLNTRETLKILHKLFYISRCKPITTPPTNRRDAPPLKGGDKKSPPLQEGALRDSEGGGKIQKPCFDYHLGHCLGVCTGEINAKDYKQKVIKPLTEFLQGHKKRLLSNLKKQMLLASKQENFEEATRLRNQIKSLQHIQDVTLLNKDFYNNVIPTKVGIQKNSPWIPNLVRNYKKILRIEAYDISNLGSTGKVGSMVVFDNHGPIKSEYRKFKIKTVSGQSDVDCLKEIIERRFNNKWPLPDIILVDGGKPQVNAIKNTLNGVGAQNFVPLRNNNQTTKPTPVIGIAKGPKRQKNEFIFDKNNKKIASFIQANENLLIQARDEAHRFAITYQKKLRKIN